MGQTADTIRNDIESRRQEMTHDIDELEQRARAMTDWRQQLNDRPMAALGVAAAGGLLLGMLTGGSKDKDRQEQPRSSYYSGGYSRESDGHNGGSGMSGWMTGERGPSQATEAGKDRAASKIDEIRGALMGLAAARAEEFLKEALPGFDREVNKVQQKSQDRSHDGSDARERASSRNASSAARSE